MNRLPTDLKRHFSRFLAAAPDRIHVAAHSHHYWPDVTFAAQQRCWEDAAASADGKWERIFGEIWPACQAGVARLLTLPDSGSLAFAPNTHEFVRRILSCLPLRGARLLTTDSEFHSFARQVARLEEEGLVAVERVAAEPFESFPERFAAAAARGGHDLVFFSQVLFNSGYALPDPAALVRAVPDPQTLVVIDGYHGFLALPTDLSAIADRAFYLAGGYKYAMAGEGCCFLHVPPGYGPRPRDTGWFAAFGALAGTQGQVAYAEGAGRFLGATFDPSGLYRLAAVLDWLQREGIEPAAIHAHVRRLQSVFLEGLDALGRPRLSSALLMPRREVPHRGNFLTFRTPEAAALQAALAAAEVVADRRDDRLRLGFGLYHDEADVERLLHRLAPLLA